MNKINFDSDILNSLLPKLDSSRIYLNNAINQSSSLNIPGDCQYADYLYNLSNLITDCRNQCDKVIDYVSKNTSSLTIISDEIEREFANKETPNIIEKVEIVKVNE